MKGNAVPNSYSVAHAATSEQPPPQKPLPSPGRAPDWPTDDVCPPDVLARPPAAFEWLYSRGRAYVYTCANTACAKTARSGNPTAQDADDLAQETWLRVWRSVSGQNGAPWDGSKAQGWLSQIVNNTWVTFQRRGLRRFENPDGSERWEPREPIWSIEATQDRRRRLAGDPDDVLHGARPYPWGTPLGRAPDGDYRGDLGGDPAEVVVQRDEADERARYLRERLASLRARHREWLLRAWRGMPDRYLPTTKSWRIAPGLSPAVRQRARNRLLLLARRTPAPAYLCAA